MRDTGATQEGCTVVMSNYGLSVNGLLPSGLGVVWLSK